jgi:hypothetical protein
MGSSNFFWSSVWTIFDPFSPADLLLVGAFFGLHDLHLSASQPACSSHLCQGEQNQWLLVKMILWFRYLFVLTLLLVIDSVIFITFKRYRPARLDQPESNTVGYALKKDINRYRFLLFYFDLE